MELARYLEVLNRRKWVVLVTTLATVLVAGLGARLQTPTYSAAATVRVAQAAQGAVEYTEYVYAERLMNTYAAMLESWPVLREVAQRLEIDLPPDDLAEQIDVEVLPNTELLRISVEDQTPAQASDIANVLAAVLVEQGQSFYFGGEKSAREILQEQMARTRSAIEQDRAVVQAMLDGEAPWDRQRIDDLNAKIKLEEEMYAELTKKYEDARLAEASRANSVTIVEPAVTPERPSQPQALLLLVMGAVVGLIGGIALAFLLESLDPTLHTITDLERATSVSVLAAIPRVNWPRSTQGVAVIAGSTESALGEAFRFLRTNIQRFSPDAGLRTILVTSAEPGVGKSVVLTNLAVSIAQAGANVVAVDTDLRRPFLHQAFHFPNERGLSSLLRGQVAPAIASLLRDTPIARVRVLTSGPALVDPAEALSQPRMRAVIQELAQSADMVLLDSPPILAVADAAILAPLVDGVLIVVGCDRTPRNQALRALRQIETVGGKPLGFVFNQARTQDGYYTRYYRSLVGARTGAASAGAARGQVRAPLWQRALRGLAIAAMALAVCFVLVSDAQQKADRALSLSMPATESAYTGSALPQAAISAASVSADVVAATRTPTAARPPALTSAGTPPTSIPTASSAHNSIARAVATPSPLPRQGMIPYHSIYLYSDPNVPESKMFLIPANWQVMILEDNVPGMTLAGNKRWTRVRVALRGDFYEGYVMSRYLQEVRP